MAIALMAFLLASVAPPKASKFEDPIPQPLTLEAHRDAATLNENGHRLAALEDFVDLLDATVSADMTFKMATVSTHAAAVLDELTRDLAVGEHRRIDRGAGFMAVVVEHLEQTKLGSFFSVAHYYESQNDLIADPDVVFFRRSDGSWSPISIQAPLGGYRVVARIREDGRPEVDERRQRELVQFANMWMKNVATQQGIRPRRSR